MLKFKDCFCHYPKGKHQKKLGGLSWGRNLIIRKEGVSNWTKQQRVKKQAESALLTKVASGELKPEDIAGEQTLIVEASKEIKPRVDNHGYDTSEEAMEVHHNRVNEEL